MISDAGQGQSPQPQLTMSSPAKTVLIVDDNPINRKLLREIMQAERYTTLEAEDGLDALSALEREAVDIIVCDILMPNMDGYTLCSEVRRRPGLENLTFILYTATNFTPNDEKLGLECGADRFIKKQGTPGVILRAIEEVLRERRERRSEHPGPPNALPSDELERRVVTRTDELAAKNAILESRTEELARSNADLEQFASAASHDLQEPLRAVAGCIQVFERKYRGKFDDKSDDLIRMIVDGSARMKALIDGILAYSRAGRDEAVLQHVLADLKVAITESKTEVVFGKLPPLRFVKTQFEQVLRNLVGNAIKYRSALGQKIYVRAERQTGAWIFSIADNGIGFEQQYAEKVFGVFQRLHARDQYMGTGIGLAIGKKIVERRGGKIWVESAPNHGSTFFFSVPDNGAPLESSSP